MFTRRLVVSLLVSFIAPTATAIAQRVPLWQVCDSTPMQYMYDLGKLISAASPNDFASIGDATGGNRLDHVVRHSTDSGRTWHELYSQGVADDNWRGVIHTTANSYTIFGDSNTYLGSDRNGNTEWRYQPYILYSHDGGVSWGRTWLDTNLIIRDIAMRNASDGVALVTHLGNIYDTLPYSLPDEILLTSDGWRTWRAIASPGKVRGAEQAFYFRDGVFKIACGDSTGTLHVYSTTDGGLSWSRGGAYPYLWKMNFVNEQVGYGAGSDWEKDFTRGLIVKTTDGGGSWTIIFNDFLNASRYGGFNDISFSDSTHGLAVGEEIFSTVDGGLSWTIVDPPFQAPSNGAGTVGAVCMLKPDFGVAVFGSTIIRYTGRTTLASPYFHSHEPGPIPIAPTTISWTPVVGGDRYELRLAMSPPWPGSAWNLFAEPVLDTVVNDTTFTYANPIPGEAFYGWVRAMNGTDTSRWRQTGDWFQIGLLFKTVSRPGLAPPPVIVSPEYDAHIQGTVRVSWTSVPGATGYEFKYANIIASNYQFIALKDTFVDLPDLTPQWPYYFQVLAYIPDDSTDWSMEGSFTVDAVNGVERSPSRQTLLVPNPASDEVHYTTDGSDHPRQVVVYDQLGRVQTVPCRVSSEALGLDVRHLPSAVYTVVVDGRAMRMVIKH